MSLRSSKFGVTASSSSCSSSKIPLIDLDNLDKFLTPGFINNSNIQDREEEYTERADTILIKIQEEGKELEKPEEKRCRQCDYLKTLFHQRTYYSPEHPRRPITQVNCRANLEEHSQFETYIPTVWVVAPSRPSEHEITVFNCPKSLRLLVVHPKE